MIMPRGEPLLLPVNPVFIVASLAAGLAINLLPLGRVVWMPDVLMVLLVFWGVHQPRRVGVLWAFPSRRSRVTNTSGPSSSRAATGLGRGMRRGRDGSS